MEGPKVPCPRERYGSHLVLLWSAGLLCALSDDGRGQRCKTLPRHIVAELLTPSVQPSNASLEDWRKAGKDVDYQLRPGEPWPSEADLPTGTPGATSMPSKIPEDQDDDEDSNQGLSGGTIAGIVIGVVAGVILIALIGFLCLRRRGFSIIRRKDESQAATRVSSVPAGGHMAQRMGSGVFEGWSQQKSPYHHHHHSSQGVYHFNSPTTPPFSASDYGTYPPHSVSPQPTTGNETVSSAVSTSPRQNGTVSPYQ